MKLPEVVKQAVVDAVLDYYRLQALYLAKVHLSSLYGKFAHDAGDLKNENQAR
jgi:hypothetical protein